MAVVYWAHLPEHIDMFNQGYVGVTTDLNRRIRSHKHKFKAYADQLIIDTVLVAEKSYCYLIEKAIRPIRNIGWNKSMGGYKNNTMLGRDNPNYGKTGKEAPNFKGWYITPKGKFASSYEAAEACNLDQMTILRKCKGRKVNNKFLQPQLGWAFEQKA
jgi:hypothetical protein